MKRDNYLNKCIDFFKISAKMYIHCCCFCCFKYGQEFYEVLGGISKVVLFDRCHGQ